MNHSALGDFFRKILYIPFLLIFGVNLLAFSPMFDYREFHYSPFRYSELKFLREEVNDMD